MKKVKEVKTNDVITEVKKSDNDMNFIFIEGTNIFHSLEAARILSRLDFDSLGH